MDLTTEDLFKKNIFLISLNKELSIDLISDTKKLLIAFIFSNLGIKTLKNALYIVIKDNINVYFKDLHKV